MNYQLELEKIINSIEDRRPGHRPTLLLHSCCAPCSSYCMEYLREYFDVTVFFYNPNITEEDEYRRRVEEEKRLIHEYNEHVRRFREGKLFDTEESEMKVTEYTGIIQILEGIYEPTVFLEKTKGLEKEPEGGARCMVCYALRLSETERVANEKGFDFFTTTLTISPLKKADKLNEIGKKLEKTEGAEWLFSDFKKKNGYKRSVELSGIFDLYRQDYCGCEFSKEESLIRRNAVENRTGSCYDRKQS